MKILVVDDSVTMRKIISKNLSSAGYGNIVEASDGSDAINKMSGIDLVILDWNMPIMDGITFVREVKNSPAYDEVPIIMCTTEGAQKEVIQALKLGVSDYIVKPFKPELIIEKVKTIIQKMNK